MHWGFGYGLWHLLWLFRIVIPVLLACGLIYWFRFRNRQLPFYNADMPPVQLSALDILRQRYARGEIDAVTFDQMRERLESTGGPRYQ
jgi:putative membrane protein